MKRYPYQIPFCVHSHSFGMATASHKAFSAAAPQGSQGGSSHCSIVLPLLLSANMFGRGSSVNYSAWQEGRGTGWGLGAHAIKPGNRPPALFAIPAQSHWIPPALCVSCRFTGSKGLCQPSDTTCILTRRALCLCVYLEGPRRA